MPGAAWPRRTNISTTQVYTHLDFQHLAKLYLRSLLIHRGAEAQKGLQPCAAGSEPGEVHGNLLHACPIAAWEFHERQVRSSIPMATTILAVRRDDGVAMGGDGTR